MIQINSLNRHNYPHNYAGTIIGIIEEKDVSLAHPLGGTCCPCDIGKYVFYNRFGKTTESSAQVAKRLGGDRGTNNGWELSIYPGIYRVWVKTKK